MSLFLTEKVNADSININCQNSNNLIDPNSIMVDIEGLHAIPTGNYTRYMPSSLEKSVRSWTHPYCKPVIMHHNEEDGKIIGRIHSVEYKVINTRSDTPALVFTVNIPDEDGKQQIRDGRLATVSVGINATDVRCSICGTNVAKHGKCEHKRGHIYNGDVCYWDIYEFFGKELSYVITPSDPFAHNIKIYSPIASTKEKSKMILNESMSPNTEAIEDPVAAVEVDTDGGTNDETTPVVEDTTAPTDGADTNVGITEGTTADNTVSTPEETDSTVTNTDDADAPVVEGTATNDEHQEPEAPVDSAAATTVRESENIAESCVACDDEAARNAMTFVVRIADLQSELREVRNVRYTLEQQLYDTMLKYKQLLAEKLNSLRVKLGKNPIDVDTLLKRSDVSLEDAISDCTTEIAVTLQESATATQDEDKVIEEQPVSNITESLKSVDNPISVFDDTLEDPEPQTTKTTTVNIRETFDGLDKVLFGR